MLRINLLPTARKRETATASPEGVRVLAVLGVLLGVGLIVGLFFFHSGKQRELEKAKSANEQLTTETRAVKSEIGDHDQVLADIAANEAKQSAVEVLQSARTGPTSLLVEVSHMLSPCTGADCKPVSMETAVREHVARGQMYNRDWDTHHVWLLKLSENEREVKIEGAGRYADDVGEFMQRLKLSRFFQNVSLEETRDFVDDATKVTVQRFKISATVRY